MSVAPSPGWSLWLSLSVLLVALDQGSKLLLEATVAYNRRVNVLPGFFDLTLRYNKGAAFSLLASQSGWQRWLFAAVALLASSTILYLLRREPERLRASAALTLILGGAVGNCIDRLAYGHVVDFLLFYWQQHYWPAFNIADAAISCGVVLYALDSCLRDHEKCT
mmetsp:Transcript_45959/g.106128  ORF Transcript_45959/g.106128 Transcript_45959/m.106128 type:complete len:165 (-) Transcript_45959:96-590(-)